MKKTPSQWREYHRQAIRHMENNGVAFCYGANGEFLTIGQCKKNLTSKIYQ